LFPSLRNLNTNATKTTLVLCWAAASLWLSSFHEPWRDEAQAWLVARHLRGLSDLFFRSAMEASGPVYYALLWPVTRIATFSTGVFWVSWTGSFLSVCLLARLLPLVLLPFLLAGAYWGYEYAVISRLYGWGCAFFLAGVFFDLKDKKREMFFFFSLAIATQLTVCFAVMAWCLSRDWKRYRFLAVVILLSLIHLKSSGAHPWSTPGWIGFVPRRLFSSLGLPFLQWPLPLEMWGALGLVLGMLLISKRERIGMALALVPFAFLFGFVYAGNASLRHAGPLHVAWLIFLRDKKYRAFALILLVPSLMTAWQRAHLDYKRAFADGIFEARTIQSLSSRPVLHAKSPLEGFVVAAELDVPFAVDGKWIGEPFYSVSEEPVTCPVGDCFYLGKEPPEATGWGLVQTSHAPIVLDESFFLFRKLN